MAEKKRWIAMYTKHIKQKRKVYHDGFLDLQIASNKVMLYDEDDNLLESRMLKAGENVGSGETLTFQAYLVDICDPKQPSEASSDLTVQPSDQECVHKSFSVLRPNFKKKSLHSEERNPYFVSKLPAKSPSHEMIRVFKKRELHKYETLSPDTVNPVTKGTGLGSADKGSKNRAIFNSPCAGAGRSVADSKSENDKLSKNIPARKPLRDVNQILSILQRQNVAETCSDNNPQTPVSSTNVHPESDTSKSHKMKSFSSRVAAASRDSKYVVQEISSASTSGSSMTHHLNDPPSFDLGI